MADRVLTFGVDGMTCGSCERRIERAVAGLEGVAKVKASAALGEVEVGFDPGRVDAAAIAAAIAATGYTVRKETAAHRARGVLPFLGLLAVVGGVVLVLRLTGGATFLPTVTQSMGYGLIFLVGLVTSVHCIAMCGGIVLSQGISRGGCTEEDQAAGGEAAPKPAGRRLAPTLLYNAGRVVSYTVIGGVVGGLGSVLSLSTALKGAIPLVAGAFMVILGVRMLGIFPWLSRLRIRIPGLSAGRAAAARRGPFLVGLLNGLMPCGPLQTMQVYALGTGSVFAGAFSMFLFSVGTVPLLLGFGAVSALLSARFTRRLAMASGVLVAALGLVMFSRGLGLFGVALPRMGPVAAQARAVGPGGPVGILPGGAAVSRLRDGVQEVTTRVLADSYQPFVVQTGVPVRWTIEVKAEDLNGCNNALVVPAYGIRKKLAPGKNVVEFTPGRPGTVAYTCWMGMITSTIEVVPDIARVSAALDLPKAAAFEPAPGPAGGAACSCCAAP